jgi:serine/threonine-protein kinase RsbW
MQKSRNTLSANAKRARASKKQRLPKTVSAASGIEVFTDSLTHKPAHVGLDTLLPFLEERVAFTMPSDLKYLDSVIDYLTERMLKLGVMKDGDSELLIALDEAIVNAVKHGNKCDARKSVNIVAEFNCDGVRFTITDEGQGFSCDEVPDPTSPCRLLEPNGRGLLLINHIMDEVCHNQQGNQIQMFKRIIMDRNTESLSFTADGQPD